MERINTKSIRLTSKQEAHMLIVSIIPFLQKFLLMILSIISVFSGLLLAFLGVACAIVAGNNLSSLTVTPWIFVVVLISAIMVVTGFIWIVARKMGVFGDEDNYFGYLALSFGSMLLSGLAIFSSEIFLPLTTLAASICLLMTIVNLIKKPLFFEKWLERQTFYEILMVCVTIAIFISPITLGS